MKKIIISIILLFSIITNAQENLINLMPDLGQGYIVLNNLQNPSVDYWEIKIIKRNYTEDFTYTDQEIEVFELIGKNYIEISDEYTYGENYIISVEAHLSDGTTNTEVKPLPCEVYGGSNYEFNKEWKCKGNTYAYGINQFLHKNGGSSYFSVESTVKTHSPYVIPYYQYFSQQQFLTLTPGTYISNSLTPVGGCNILSYYGISQIDLQQPASNPNYATSNGNGINVIKILNNVPNVTYYDGTNNPINPITSPIVYGIKKGLGPWCGSNSGNCLQTPILTYGDKSSDPIGNAIGIINNFGSPVPCGKHSLVCSGIPYNFPKLVGDSALKMDSRTPSILDTHIYVFGILATIDEIINGDNIGNWWENYHALSISNLSNNGGQIMNLKITDLFDSNGEPINTYLTLNPGLYTIGIQFSDGNYLPIVNEVKTEQSTTNNLSNFLSVNIYPVPITNNEFTMNLSASQELQFEYLLYDFNANLIYSTDILINENSNEDFQVVPDYAIPQGILVNVFRFEDGSQLSILTMKN